MSHALRPARSSSTRGAGLGRRLPVAVAGIAISLLAVATVANAHDFWLVPNAFAITGDATVDVSGNSGTRFPTSDGATQPASIAEARLIGASGEARITDMVVEGKSLRLKHKPFAPGQYLVVASLQPRTTHSTGGAFRRYLALEGAADEAARLERDAAFPTTDSLIYRSTKYAATIVEVGAGPRAFAKTTGYAIEFVPLSDPGRATVGDTLRFRVVSGGRGVAGLRIHVGAAADSALRGRGAAGGGDPDQHLLTDGDGIIHVHASKAGAWNLRTAQVAAPSASGQPWDVHWVTYVFNVGASANARSSNTATSAGDVALAPMRMSDSTDVVAAVARFHSALASGDSAAALALLATDALILESGEMQTRAEYRSHHLPADIAFAAAVPSTRTVAQIVVRGDAAWVTSTSATQGTFNGRSVNSAGVELVVLARTASGWQIRAIHWSSRARRAGT